MQNNASTQPFVLKIIYRHLQANVYLHIFYFCVSGSLQVSNSQEIDQGKYECVAENELGTEYSHAIMLYVKGEYTRLQSEIHARAFQFQRCLQKYAVPALTHIYISNEAAIFFAIYTCCTRQVLIDFM